MIDGGHTAKGKSVRMNKKCMAELLGGERDAVELLVVAHDVVSVVLPFHSLVALERVLHFNLCRVFCCFKVRAAWKN